MIRPFHAEDYAAVCDLLIRNNVEPQAVFDNRLRQGIIATHTDRVWTTDITYISTYEG